MTHLKQLLEGTDECKYTHTTEDNQGTVTFAKNPVSQ